MHAHKNVCTALRFSVGICLALTLCLSFGGRPRCWCARCKYYITTSRLVSFSFIIFTSCASARLACTFKIPVSRMYLQWRVCLLALLAAVRNCIVHMFGMCVVVRATKTGFPRIESVRAGERATNCQTHRRSCTKSFSLAHMWRRRRRRSDKCVLGIAYVFGGTPSTQWYLYWHYVRSTSSPMYIIVYLVWVCNSIIVESRVIEHISCSSTAHSTHSCKQFMLLRFWNA